MDISVIRGLLKDRKISQREIAEQIGMSQAGFNNALASGDFKASTLEKIAVVLEVPVSYFFSEGNNIKIKGQVHSGIGDNIKAESNNELLLENELLKEKNEGLKRENELLKEMVEMLKKK